MTELHMTMARLSASISLAALLSAAIAGPASAECAAPGPAPQMPQGATASEEAMKTGREQLQAYVDSLQIFQACMSKQIADAPPDTKPEVKARWAAEHDASIDAARNLADVYSAQLRAFKGQRR